MRPMAKDATPNTRRPRFELGVPAVICFQSRSRWRSARDFSPGGVKESYITAMGCERGCARHGDGWPRLNSEKRLSVPQPCGFQARFLRSGRLCRGAVFCPATNPPLTISASEFLVYTVIQSVQNLLSLGTFVVKRFERNSRNKFMPTRPARPTAALVKTRFAPRFALG